MKKPNTYLSIVPVVLSILLVVVGLMVALILQFQNQDTRQQASTRLCTQEVKLCQDGSYVSRDPENGCAFDPCPGEKDAENPQICPRDVKQCPDGTGVIRDPNQNCEFPACPTDEPDPTVAPNPCVRAGCSSQLCVPADQARDIVTNCAFRPEYACYQDATCELQGDGSCGFTQTTQLEQCLEQYTDQPSPVPSPTPTPTPQPTLEPSPSPTLRADFNNDGQVNLIDYGILAEEFMKDLTEYRADITGDGRVDMFDYAILNQEFSLI